MSGAGLAGNSGEHVAAAAAALTRARALLLEPAPQNLDMASASLATAIAPITALQKLVHETPSRELMASVLGLREEVDRVSGLLEHAASYHVRLLGAMIEAANSPAVESGNAAPVRRLSVSA